MGKLNTFIVIVVYCFLSTFGSEDIGLRLEQVNGQYHFSAGTSVLALVLSPLFLAFLFLHRPLGKRETIAIVVPLWRRFAAFFIDFSTALLAMGSILTLPSLLMERKFTGIMFWQFTRDFPRPTDSLLAFWTVIPMFLWLIFYLSYPLTKGSQTIGQYVLGYRIAKKGVSCISIKPAIIRTIISFFVMCLGWVSVPMAFYDNQKHMFHDSDDGLRPELVSYKR